MRGLLETIRVQHGQPLELPLHQCRLASSWPAVFPGEPPELAPLVASALEACVPEEALLRMAFESDARGAPCVTASLRACAPPAERLRVAVAHAPRAEPAAERRHKLLDRRWAQRHRREDCDETLVWSVEAGILEGLRTSVWILEGRRLVTPPEEAGLVPGIVRARLLQLVPASGLELVVESIPLHRFLRADGVLLSGSGVDLCVAEAIDGAAWQCERAGEVRKLLWAHLRPFRSARDFSPPRMDPGAPG